MKQKVLITGANGMLGIDLKGILERSCTVVPSDVTRRRRSFFTRDDIILCDVTKRKSVETLVSRVKPDIVVHAAAWTDVDGCELEKENAITINSRGTRNVAYACREAGALMIYVSSDFVFDGVKSEPYTEEDGTNPLNAYGLSKLKGEEAVRSILERYYIVRTSWLFGRYGRNFVDIILDKAERKEELRVVMDQFGSPTYTMDFAEALAFIVNDASRTKDNDGVYHFANKGSCSWFRYAEEILRAAGKRHIPITPITSGELKRPAVRPGMSILNTEKFIGLRGREPRTWQRALQDYLRGHSKSTSRNTARGTGANAGRSKGTR